MSRQQRVTLSLPLGFTARRCAAGRKNAARWEIYAGAVADENCRGELVRFDEPAGPVWQWQPLGSTGVPADCASAAEAIALIGSAL